MCACSLAFGKVRLQRLRHTRIHRRPELLPDGRLVEGHRLPKAAWDEQPERPCAHEPQQPRVANQELAKVYGDAAVDEIREDQMVGAALLDPDRQLVREAADDALASGAERDVRVVLRAQVVVAHEREEPPLVRLGAEPPAVAVTEHRVQNHHALDHPADGQQPSIPVVGLADGLVQRPVVNVVEPSAAHRSGLDGTGEPARHESADEVAAVLAAHGAGERAVLPFKEAAGVDHDGHQELALPLGEAKARECLHPLLRDAVQGAVDRILARHRNSSAPRGRGTDRPPPPRDPTT